MPVAEYAARPVVAIRITTSRKVTYNVHNGSLLVRRSPMNSFEFVNKSDDFWAEAPADGFVRRRILCDLNALCWHSRPQLGCKEILRFSALRTAYWALVHDSEIGGQILGLHAIRMNRKDCSAKKSVANLNNMGHSAPARRRGIKRFQTLPKPGRDPL